MEKINQIMKSKALVGVFVVALVVIALWLIITRLNQPGGTSVADNTTFTFTQTVPTSGTAIVLGDPVEISLVSPSSAGLVLPAFVNELSVTYNPNLFTLSDIIVSAPELLSLGKTIDNSTGNAKIDIAYTPTGQPLAAGYIWAVLKFTSKSSTTTTSAINGTSVLTYSLPDNTTTTTTTTMSVNVNLSATQASSSSSSATTSSSTSSATSTTTSSASTTTSSSSTSSGSSTVATGTVCGPMDVDSNQFLDIVDFAAFAKLYNKTCDSHTGTNLQVTDYTVGQQATLDVLLKNVSTNANAVDLDIAVTNATVTNFVQTTSTSWLSGIGFCNANGSIFTANAVCVALAKSTNITANELAGKITLSFNSEGTVQVTTNSKFAYSDGTQKTPASYSLYTLTVGAAGQGADVCGNQDANDDSKVDLNDFSKLGRVYRKANCGVN